MNANESESNHKKKLIVPIIAIMLCAVAVIGAGYAYQSSLSLNNNSLDGGNITVTLNTGEGDAHPVFYKDDGKLDVVFTQEIVYAMDSTGQYVPTVNTAANGVDTSDSSNLGTLSVKYSNTTGKNVYAYVSVKVSNSVIQVGNTPLNLSSIVEGISISPIGGTNTVDIGLSDMVDTPKEFNLYGAHALLGIIEGNYSVVLNVNTVAFTGVGGDQDSMNKLIEELEKITFEITVNISDVDPDGSA